MRNEKLLKQLFELNQSAFIEDLQDLPEDEAKELIADIQSKTFDEFFSKIDDKINDFFME